MRISVMQRLAVRRLAPVLLICFVFLGGENLGRLHAQQPTATAPPTVVFMTDFGVVDDSVALCKGVMTVSLQICGSSI